jgi:hypothetical protein
MTGDELIGELWNRCRASAQEAGTVPAEAVQRLISHSREILGHYGCSKRDADLVFFGIYTVAHWDWPEPTARIFETLLEIELSEFFAERQIN